MNEAYHTCAEAFRAFDRRRAEHDPEGEMDILEASVAYAAWADTNSIEPYLDASQQHSAQGE